MARHALLKQANRVGEDFLIVLDRVVVCALEWGAWEFPITLHSGENVTEYNYILTKRVKQGTLLAFLMRANHNNRTGMWKKLSVKLQRYFAR